MYIYIKKHTCILKGCTKILRTFTTPSGHRVSGLVGPRVSCFDLGNLSSLACKGATINLSS